MSRIHPLSIIIFLTGVVLAIVGIVLAVVFGVQHAKEQSCPAQNNCQAELFSLRTGLQGVTWTPGLGVVGSPDFKKQQALAQTQLQSVLQGSLSSAPSNKAARLDVSTDPTGNNVIVSVTKFALATDGVTVIAFASGAVAGSQTGLTDLPTNYTTTFQQSLDQDDQVAKGGAVVSDDSTTMCESVVQQLPDLVTPATAYPTPKATTATCAPCPTMHTIVPTSCPHCPSCPTQPAPTNCPNTTCPFCPEPTACPTAEYLTTLMPTTCPKCPIQTDCPTATSCPEPAACPTDMALTTAAPVTCPICPTQAGVTCPACPETTACPTADFQSTLIPTTCPECPIQTDCPEQNICPTKDYSTTAVPTTCPVCPEPTTCPTVPASTTQEYISTTEAVTTVQTCNPIFEGDIALVFEETMSAVSTGLAKEMQSFMTDKLLFASGAPYLFDGNTTRVQVFPYGETESYYRQINFDFAQGPHTKANMNDQFTSINDANGIFFVDSAVINDGLIAVLDTVGHGTRYGAVIIVADNDQFASQAARSAQVLQNRGWLIIVVSFNQIGDFSKLTTNDNIYYTTGGSEENGIGASIGQKLVQYSNPGCVFTQPPTTSPAQTTPQPTTIQTCKDLFYEGDIAIVFEETVYKLDTVDITMQSFIQNRLIFGPDLPYRFNGKDTRMQLYPYGDTNYYDLNQYFEYGPLNNVTMNDILVNVNYYCNEYDINEEKINDGLKAVLETSDHGTRYGAVIVVAYSDDYVKDAVGSANSLEKIGWDLFVVSFNPQANFSRLTTSDNIYYRNTVDDETNISNSIAQKLVQQSNPQCGFTPQPTAPSTPPQQPSTPSPTTIQPVCNEIYEGDIAVVFEETVDNLNTIDITMQSFLENSLIFGSNLPYKFNGNDTRVQLYPYGYTSLYNLRAHFQNGPLNITSMNDALKYINYYCSEYDIDEEKIEDGLKAVSVTPDHGTRFGAVIVVAYSDKYVRGAVYWADALKTIGWDIFVVSFNPGANFAQLTTRDNIYYRNSAADDTNISNSIAQKLVQNSIPGCSSPSPTPPQQPSTPPPTTIQPVCNDIYEGDIAVVFEEINFRLQTVDIALQSFIEKSLIFGPNLPYKFNGEFTRVQLYPYGYTSLYGLNQSFRYGPLNIASMNSSLSSINYSCYEYGIDEEKIKDGLEAVLATPNHGTRPGAVIVVAFSDEYVKGAVSLANSLKKNGWDLFVVSFNQQSNFSRLTTSDNIYYRNSVDDETNISNSIAQKLVQSTNPDCTSPSTTLPQQPSTPPPTTIQPICKEIYEGDIAVVFEETVDNMNTLDQSMQSFIENHLIFGKGLPYDFNSQDTRLQLYPYGDTTFYDLNLSYQYGPKSKADVKNLFLNINYYCDQYGINVAKVNDGLSAVLSSPGHGNRSGTVILVAYSDTYVKAEAVASANSLKKNGWNVFVVSFNPKANFTRLTSSDNIYYRNSAADDTNISNSIAQKIVSQSNNGCNQSTGPTSTVTKKATPTTKPSTSPPTNCPSQSFYYGDVAIVFEQTMTVINDIPHAIHNFINFRLLSYVNNPYIIDGNTTRVLLAPYGDTIEYRLNDSYAYGPRSLEDIYNILVPLDDRTEEFEYDTPLMKDGLAAVRSASDHGGRVGSIIIIGLRDTDVQISRITSKTLQRAGYNVFTVSFSDSADLSPLASNKDFAFTRYIESDEQDIAAAIGKYILATTLCDPNPPATALPTTVQPPDKYFIGNIAVVFEQTHDNIDTDRDSAIHDFITYRLLFYPGNVYLMPVLTKALLIPYGNTTKYSPYKQYKDSVTSLENVADEMENFEEIDAYNFFNVPNMEDGLNWVKNIPSPGGSLAVIVIGYSDKFVQSSLATTNSLKNAGYQVFTVSFNESAVFDPLATDSDYVFTRKSEADEIGIAQKIGDQLIRGPPSPGPSTLPVSTTSHAPTTEVIKNCTGFYGNLAILFEETMDLIDSQTQESTLHNYITNSLLAYEGNPYTIDGTTTRIMLAPFGDTISYLDVSQSWELGPRNLTMVRRTLQDIFLSTQMFDLNTPNMQDGLKYVLDSQDGADRQSAVVLIGYSSQFIATSEATSKQLQQAGYHVFTVSFAARTNYAPLASDAASSFTRITKGQEDGISKHIGDWLMSQPQQQCGTTGTTEPAMPSVATTPPSSLCPGQNLYYGDIAIVFEETKASYNFGEHSIKNFVIFKLLGYLNNPYIIDGQTTRILLVPYGDTDNYNLNDSYVAGPASLDAMNAMFFTIDEDMIDYEYNDPDMKSGLQFVKNAKGHNGRVGAVIVIGLNDAYAVSSQSVSKSLQRAGYNVLTVSFSPTGNFSALASDPNLVYIRNSEDDELPIAEKIGDFLKSTSPCDPVPRPTGLPTTAVSPTTKYAGNIAVVFEESWLDIRYSTQQPMHDFLIYRLFNFPGNSYSFPDSTRAIFIPYGSTDYYNVATSFKSGSIHNQEDISDELENFDLVADLYLLDSTSIIDGLNYLINIVPVENNRPQTVIIVGISGQSVKNATGAAKTLRNKGYNIITVAFGDQKFDALASGPEYVFTRTSEKDEIKIAEDISNLLTTLSPTPACAEQNLYYGDIAVVFEETNAVFNSQGYSIHDFIVFKLFGYANNPYVVDGVTSRILMVPYGNTESFPINNSYAAGPNSLEALNNMMLPIDDTALENDFNTPNMKTGLQFVKNALDHKGRIGAVIIVGLSDVYVTSSQSAFKSLQRAGYNVATVSFSPDANFAALASNANLVFFRNSEDDELAIAKQIGDFLKSTSPCDPVPPTTALPTTAISPTTAYSGNIAVVFEETFLNIHHNREAAIHDFLIYRLFNFPGNPYSFPGTTRALMIPYGLTDFYNLGTSYAQGSISNQEDISDELENFDIIAETSLLDSTDISDGLNYLNYIERIHPEDDLPKTAIIVGISDQYVKNASTAAALLRTKGYNIITVSFNESAKFDSLASAPEYVFTRTSEKDEVKIAEDISNILMGPPSTQPTEPSISTTSKQCPGQNIYYGDVAVVYEETLDVAEFQTGFVIRDFIAFRLFAYLNNPYIIDGDTSRILLAPYGNTDAYPLVESYEAGPESLEYLNNLLVKMDEVQSQKRFNTPNIKTGLQFVSSADGHAGRVGTVIIIGLSFTFTKLAKNLTFRDSFVAASVSASKSLQKAGYNVLTVSFDKTADFGPLTSSGMNFTRNFREDEEGIAQQIGEFLKSTSPCDPSPPTGATPTTDVSPTKKYLGNIAVVFEQTSTDDQDAREPSIHDFMIYRLFNFLANPYQLGGTTKVILVPYGQTDFYTLSSNYKYGSVRSQDEISDELVYFDNIANYYAITAPNMNDGLHYVADDILTDQKLPNTVILIGYSDTFVVDSLVSANTLRETQGYNIITVSFNASAKFGALATGPDYVFTRNTENDETNIARDISNLLLNPPTPASSTVKPSTAPVTHQICPDQKFYYGDLAIVFEETLDILQFETGRAIHDFITFNLLTYQGNPYVIDGNTTRFLLVPYGETSQFSVSESYKDGPSSPEDLNNRFEPMDVITQIENLDSPNMKEGLQFVKNALDHNGRAGNVIIIGKSARYVQTSVAASKALQKAGYNVFTVSFDTTQNFAPLASNLQYVNTRNSAKDETTIAELIGSVIVTTSTCDPVLPTGPAPTVVHPENPYNGNIAIVFQQSRDNMLDGTETIIHDFLTYRLLSYTGNPYVLGINTKALLIPFGQTSSYAPSKDYKYSVRSNEEISDELENIDYLCNVLFIDSFDINDGLTYVEQITQHDGEEYTVIIVGYSSQSVQKSKKSSLKLQSMGYRVFTVSFNYDSPLDALATSPDYAFTRNNEQDETIIAKSIANMLMNPSSLAPPSSTVAPVCQDISTTCASIKNRCHQPAFEKTLEQTCRLTCGYCTPDTTVQPVENLSTPSAPSATSPAALVSATIPSQTTMITNPTVGSTETPSNCVQDVYFGDIAIVFEQTYKAIGSGAEKDMHNFINFHLLSYATHNPYRIDGNSTRILLVPYGQTTSFHPSNSYAQGPKSMEQISDQLVKFDDYILETQSGVADINEGLTFVQTAQDHGSRVGSIIIIGTDNTYLNLAKPTSKSLQNSGYTVFTVSFNSKNDLSSLASNKAHAYQWKSENDDDTTAEKIGVQILATAPCDPNALTGSTPAVSPVTPYKGNIAVVFEQTYNDILSQQTQTFHNFITYRLFYYPGNPYYLDQQNYTQTILVPYGKTATYNVVQEFENGPSSKQQIADQLEGYLDITEVYEISSKNIADGLSFVLNKVEMNKNVPQAVILCGYSPDFIKSSATTADELKNQNYKIFTVSFNDQVDFFSLSSGVGYHFTRFTESDELGIAMAIGSKLVEEASAQQKL